MIGKWEVGQVHEAEITCRKLGWTPQLLDRIAKSEELARKLAVVAFSHGEEFRVRVDYDKSLAEMLAACNCPLVDPIITQGNFPVSGYGLLYATIRLFHFEIEEDRRWIVPKVQVLRHRPARIEELLALGAARSELQTRFGIVAFGSVSPRLYEEDHGVATGRGECYVAFLGTHDGERQIGTLPFNMRFLDKECRFAAVPL